MPVNVWSAGSDALLDFLSKREADQRLTEDRARQKTLDDENRRFRESSLELQARQIQGQDQDRNDRIEAQRAANEFRQAELNAKTEQEKAKAKALAEAAEGFANAKTAEERDAWRARANAIRGEALPAERPKERPFSAAPGTTLLDPETRVPFFTAPNRPTAGASATKIPPLLKSMIDDASSQGMSIDQTRVNAAKAANALGVDLAEVSKYINSVYPVGTTEDGKRMPLPVGVVPDEAAAPQGRTMNQITGTDAPLPPIGQAPTPTWLNPTGGTEFDASKVVAPGPSKDIALGVDPFRDAKAQPAPRVVRSLADISDDEAKRALALQDPPKVINPQTILMAKQILFQQMTGGGQP